MARGMVPFVGVTYMTRIVLAGAMALALVGSAFAQSATVTIAPEQRTKIKTFVYGKEG